MLDWLDALITSFLLFSNFWSFHFTFLSSWLRNISFWLSCTYVFNLGILPHSLVSSILFIFCVQVQNHRLANASNPARLQVLEVAVVALSGSSERPLWVLTHTHNAHTHTCTHVHMHIYTRTYMHTHAHVHTHALTLMHTCAHTHIHPATRALLSGPP